MGIIYIGLDIGDPAAHRFQSLGLNFVRPNGQCLAHRLQIGVEHQGTVMHNPSLPQILGVSGKLFVPDGHVVAAIDLSRHPHLPQGVDHRPAKGREVDHSALTISGHKSKVQIAPVMIYRTASRQPPNHGNTVLLYIGTVDLLQNILVFAHHNRPVVLPQHEAVLSGAQLVKDKLLQGKVPGGIHAGAIQVIHDLPNLRQLSRS